MKFDIFKNRTSKNLFIIFKKQYTSLRAIFTILVCFIWIKYYLYLNILRRKEMCVCISETSRPEANLRNRLTDFRNLNMLL